MPPADWSLDLLEAWARSGGGPEDLGAKFWVRFLEKPLRLKEVIWPPPGPLGTQSVVTVDPIPLLDGSVKSLYI